MNINHKVEKECQYTNVYNKMAKCQKKDFIHHNYCWAFGNIYFQKTKIFITKPETLIIVWLFSKKNSNNVETL